MITRLMLSEVTATFKSIATVSTKILVSKTRSISTPVLTRILNTLPTNADLEEKVIGLFYYYFYKVKLQANYNIFSLTIVMYQ